MKRVDDHVEMSEKEASGGTKRHGVRYVLAISLFLAVVVMSLAWIIPSIAQ